jgi:hypothetical protein
VRRCRYQAITAVAATILIFVVIPPRSAAHVPLAGLRPEPGIQRELDFGDLRPDGHLEHDAPEPRVTGRDVLGDVADS